MYLLNSKELLRNSYFVLVVDSNRIIAALVKDSYSRKIILHGDLELLAINMSQKDIQKYKTDILSKAKITEEQFNSIFEKLNEKLIKLDDDIIEGKMKEAKEIMDNIDKDDTPFIAAALAAKADIWSDDEHFQRQNKVKVWRTKDLCFN